MRNEWISLKLLGDHRFFFPIILISIVCTLSWLPCKALAAELLAANTVQPLNSVHVSGMGQECKQPVTNGIVTLDNELVPVWTRDSQSDRYILPDAPTRAYRLGTKTCISLTHFVNARICGSSLTNLNGPTEVVYHSPENVVFPKFDYHNWLMSPYVLNDNTLIALTHSEWYDCLRFSKDSPKA